MSLTEKELPVLSDVVQPGDAAIIRSCRRRLADTVMAVGQTTDVPPAERVTFELPAHLLADGLSGEARNDQGNEGQDGIDSRADALMTNEALETMIDDIIDRHISSLRNDLRTLLTGVQTAD